MIVRRLDDYQSWQIQFGGTSLLIDPWLTDDPISGAFDRRHGHGFTTLADLRRESGTIGSVLLCTSVNDHLHPATMRALSASSDSVVPVHGPVKAVKLARSFGCTDTHRRQPGDTFTVAAPEGGSLHITVTRTGLPLGLIAVGYLIEAIDAAGDSQGRVWIEPHQPTRSVAASLAPVDVALLPTQAVTAVVLPVTAGPRRSVRAALAARAHTVIPTATDPRRDMTWWQKVLYIVTGSTRRAFERAAPTPTQVIELAAGDWFDVRKKT
ncbi:MAG: MBL fold metallo-hydrolase [Ilumatobacteraceae bacterium]